MLETLFFRGSSFMSLFLPQGEEGDGGVDGIDGEQVNSFSSHFLLTAINVLK